MAKNKPQDQVQLKSMDEMIEEVKRYQTNDEPEAVLKEASKWVNSYKDPEMLPVSMDFFKASTLNEFNNGVLMCEGIFEQFRPLAISFMRGLIKDYDCQTAGERATAELATMEYIRCLELNQRMKESFFHQDALGRQHGCGNSSFADYKSCGACRKLDIEQRLFETMGKELDRAHRHFHAAIQTLRMAKQPPLQVNVRTDTAVIGQNQQVQTNHTNNHATII